MLQPETTREATYEEVGCICKGLCEISLVLYRAPNQTFPLIFLTNRKNIILGGGIKEGFMLTETYLYTYYLYAISLSIGDPRQLIADETTDLKKHYLNIFIKNNNKYLW